MHDGWPYKTIKTLDTMANWLRPFLPSQNFELEPKTGFLFFFSSFFRPFFFSFSLLPPFFTSFYSSFPHPLVFFFPLLFFSFFHSFSSPPPFYLLSMPFYGLSDQSQPIWSLRCHNMKPISFGVFKINTLTELYTCEELEHYTMHHNSYICPHFLSLLFKCLLNYITFLVLFFSILALSIHHIKKGGSVVSNEREVHTLKMKLQEIMKGNYEDHFVCVPPE